jgi:cbb3-type cytochrome oxidase subunit 3
MKSQPARLALVVIFVMALGVTAYLFRKTETARRAEAAAGESFNAQAQTTVRSILDLRAAQQAYVATGQGEDFWAAKVAETLSGLRDSVAALRASATAPDAKAGLDTASGLLQDFAQMDSRARAYVRNGQRLLASDTIFSNGTELTDAATAAIDKASGAEMLARAAAAETFERRQSFALIAAAAAGALVMLLLLPRVDRDVPPPVFLEPGVRIPVLATSRAKKAAPSTAASSDAQPAVTAGTVTSPSAPDTAPQTTTASTADVNPAPVLEPSTPAAAVAPALNFTAVAALCTELSRVDDTTALPPLLERAATLLDAAGVILWISDAEGRELIPALAHGYPQHLVNRLGAIPRDAENATAAAFRTGLLQTVFGDGSSNGAIAAPLVSGTGCFGVMAAEVKADTEKLEANLAAATILAAQLASLVGPAAIRSSDPEADSQVEAANA